MNTLCLIAAKFNTTLNLKTAIGATSATLDSATDDSGVALPTGRYGLTIDGGTAAEEFITCTLTGTALTSIKTVTMQGVETSGMTKTHRKGATVKITDFVVIKKMLDLLDGTTNFNSSVTLGYDGTATISSANQFATKAYVDATATGTTNFDQVVIAGNAGATVSAGQLLYLDVADGEWKLCDADTAATVDNIILGLAQGAGTDGNPITGGILTYGLDYNQTGLTTNTAYYAGNTAGAIVSTPGTTEVSVGVSRSTTSIFFDPRYNQQITEDIQDALAGTSGTPSSTNKYVTNDDTSATSSNSKVYRLKSNGKIDATMLEGNLPALDGSALTNLPITFSNGTTTKNSADASTTQNIAHGLGRIPRKVRIRAIFPSVQSGGSLYSDTVYNGTTQSSFSITARASGSGYIEGTDFFRLNGNYGSTSEWQTGVVTFDSTNIIITWTKTGSPTGTYTLLWEAE